MKDERLPKIYEKKKQEGCRKRGRPQLRWEDYVKRYLRMACKGGRKGNNREQWKTITKVAVHRSDNRLKFRTCSCCVETNQLQGNGLYIVVSGKTIIISVKFNRPTQGIMTVLHNVMSSANVTCMVSRVT